jgi:hypothetical protein
MPSLALLNGGWCMVGFGTPAAVVSTCSFQVRTLRRQPGFHLISILHLVTLKVLLPEKYSYRLRPPHASHRDPPDILRNGVDVSVTSEQRTYGDLQ